jgi:hypothetical protein
MGYVASALSEGVVVTGVSDVDAEGVVFIGAPQAVSRSESESEKTSVRMRSTVFFIFFPP